jgi:hypothetical protein
MRRIVQYPATFWAPSTPPPIVVPAGFGWSPIMGATSVVYGATFATQRAIPAPPFVAPPFSEQQWHFTKPRVIDHISLANVPPVTPTVIPAGFGSSPIIGAASIVFGGISHALVAPTVAQTPKAWWFSESPAVLKKTTPWLWQWGDFAWQPAPAPFVGYYKSPALVFRRRVMPGHPVWPPTTPAAAPTVTSVFTDSPVALKVRTPAGIVSASFDNQFSPLVLLQQGPVFAENQWRFQKPFRVALERLGFDDTFATLIPAGPVFAESQRAFRPPKALLPWSDIAFLQIAYTPGPLTFAESPWRIRPPRLLEQPGFVNIPVAVTPAALTFSESPIAFKRTTPWLWQWNDYPFLPVPAPFIGYFKSPALLFRRRVITSPVSAAPTPPPSAAFTAWGSFSESPTRTQLAKALLPWTDISFLQIAYTPSFFPWSESPTRRTPPRAFDQPGFQFLPPAVPTPQFWGMFAESPWQFKGPKAALAWADISFLQIAYTPTALAFSESPRSLVKPKAVDQPGFQVIPAFNTWGMFSESPAALKKPVPLYPWADISFLQVAYTPAALTFTESPYALRRPRPFEQQPWASFVPPLVPTPTIWGMFSESPYQLKSPRPLYPWADIAFLQIAYTPGPLAFSESPWAFKAPRPFDQPGFQFFPIAVPTPTTWGMFSESQWWFRRPFQLNAFADIAFLQIAYTPNSWGQFSESPYALRKPLLQVYPWADYPWQPISLVPLVFAESPTRRFPPFLLQQWADISFLQIAYTPSIWGMFTESPAALKRNTPWLGQWADISFLQIAYTPSSFGFSEPSIANRNIRGWQQRLDQPGIMPNQPPPGTLTPSALVFSESPTHVTARWMGAAILSQEGMWGWAFPPPVVVTKVWEWHIRYRRRGRR